MGHALTARPLTIRDVMILVAFGAVVAVVYAGAAWIQRRRRQLGAAGAGDGEDLAERGRRGVQLVDVAGDQPDPDHARTAAGLVAGRRRPLVR